VLPHTFAGSTRDDPDVQRLVALISPQPAQGRIEQVENLVVIVSGF
jgi:hypothetical protein